MKVNFANFLKVLLLLSLFLLSPLSLSLAQDDDSEEATQPVAAPLSVTIRSLLVNGSAIATFGLATELQEIFNQDEMIEQFFSGESFITVLSPSVKIKTTSDGTGFEAITFGVRGQGIAAPVFIGEDDLPVFQLDQFFGGFEYSGGIETDRYFENISLLGEVGFVPFQRISPYFLGLNPFLAVYLQTGYKFGIWDGELKSGGAVDQSLEKPNSALLRIKLGGKGDFELPLFGEESAYSLGLEPEGWLWYDIINSTYYHNVRATVKLNFAEGRYFDWTYESGSGAPNFNQGTQFSTGLTITF